jgi:ATP-dependent Clp protease ATP-binding subunit ClpA
MTYGVDTTKSPDQNPIYGQIPFTDEPTQPPRRTLAEEPKPQIPTEATPTDNLAACLDSGLDLATRLNHPQVDLLHVVVGMSLDENGRIGLQENGIDFETAHANSLSALTTIAPICPRLSPEDMPETRELLKVRNAAIAIAKQRDPQQRTISIDDFVKALLTDASEKTLQTVAGGRRPSADETAFKEWQERVEGTLLRIEAARTISQPEPANDNTQVRRLVRVAGIAILSIGAACLVYLSQ